MDGWIEISKDLIISAWTDDLHALVLVQRRAVRPRKPVCACVSACMHAYERACPCVRPCLHITHARTHARARTQHKTQNTKHKTHTRQPGRQPFPCTHADSSPNAAPLMCAEVLATRPRRSPVREQRVCGCGCGCARACTCAGLRLPRTLIPRSMRWGGAEGVSLETRAHSIPERRDPCRGRLCAATRR